ncbi:MAG: DUF1674 domain-containing protein [Gammaproteobacteria bacterium]|nr:DUF1674 domain-containing protein [Gammaproteobacteria bacterium]QOJ33273.1 MAG: DUF1674 domain-containing protein [Gammaproteobacteria bacterium]
MPAADPRPDGDSGEPRPARPQDTHVADAVAAQRTAQPGRREIGGPAGPEPTRFGDWEKGGRCIDF